MYTIHIPAKAKRQLKLISQKHKKGVAVVLEELKEDPLVGKPFINELIKSYSYKIGTYRIIYTIDKKDKIVTVLSAGHRATVYVVN